MRNFRTLIPLALIALVAVIGCQDDVNQQPTAPMSSAFSTPLAASGPLSGAIFTTTVDGSIVNENVRYEVKEDVYLDGGPGPNAPPSAAP